MRGGHLKQVLLPLLACFLYLISCNITFGSFGRVSYDSVIISIILIIYLLLFIDF